MKLPTPLGDRRRARLRRTAAAIVLDDAGHDRIQPAPAPASGAADPQLDAEVQAMHSLGALLAELPEAGWGPRREPARAPGRARRTTRSSHARIGQIAGLAAVCLAAAFTVGSLTHPTLAGSGSTPAGVHSSRPRARSHRGGEAGAHVVLRPLPGQTQDGLAVAYMKGSSRMLLKVKRLRPSPPGTYYELWLMTSDTDLVAVAGFRVDRSGTAELSLVLPDSPRRYAYLDVSLQKLDAGTRISQTNVLRGSIS